MGVVQPCGLGEPVEHRSVSDTAVMREDCARSNGVLLVQLRTDEAEDELMEQTRADAAMGRMTVPCPGTFIAFHCNPYHFDSLPVSMPVIRSDVLLPFLWQDPARRTPG